MKITNDLFLNNQNRNVTGNDGLGKDAFLQILMTQLQNQDPLSPMDDKQFISQLATFSSLEQLTNLNTNMTTLIDENKALKMTGYGELIGKSFSWTKETLDENGEISLETKEGILNSVTMNNGVLELIMNDGSKVNEDMISSFIQTKGTSFIEAGHLIGKSVTWQENDEEQTAIVQAVRNEPNGITLRLDNGELIEAQDILSIAQGITNS